MKVIRKNILYLFIIGIFLILFNNKAMALELVSGNWDITNDSGAPANDFHMKIDIEEPATVILPGANDFFNDGIFGNRTATHTSGADFNVNWTNANENINIGQTIHIGFEFKSSRNEARISDAYWTFKGQKTPGKQPALPGMRATDLFDDLTYTIFNDTVVDLTIQDLQFSLSPHVTDLQSMIPYTLSGFGASIPEFTLAPGESTSLNPGSIGPGEFLLTQLTAFPTADPTNIVRLMQQHEAPVPEPSTICLLGFALIGLVGLNRRKFWNS